MPFEEFTENQWAELMTGQANFEVALGKMTCTRFV